MVESSQVISGLPSVDYYAPNFKVFVEGHELDPESHGDILDVKVTMEKDSMTGFDLTVNNWDDKSFDFKYSDTARFDIGKSVQIQMGYADQLRSMVSGIISSMTPRFPAGGPPTLSVSGLDRRLKLKDKKPDDKKGEIKKFVNKTDWEIAEIIARRNKMEVQTTKEGKRHALVIQKDQDELTFLMERAKRIDFDFYVRMNPLTGTDKLFFVKPTDNRDARRSRVFKLEWGQNLITFNPKLSINDQVAQMTVKGWDPATKKKISYTASSTDLPPDACGGRSGPEAARDRLDGKTHDTVDRPVASVEEARDLARSLLLERAYGYLTGTGQIIGLPDLRPGDNLELLGLGQRYSGTSGCPVKYFVKKVTHSIGGNGYLTDFEVRSIRDGGTRA